MKNEPLWNKTVDILVKAYLGDTLTHGDCSACAVGNMICANLYNSDFKIWNNKFTLNYNDLEGNWSDLFLTDGLTQHVYESEAQNETIVEQVASTGYLWQDLAKIEFAFETAPQGNNSDEWIFNGLMSVIDTLMQIHEANDTEAQEAKGLFRKELAV